MVLKFDRSSLGLSKSVDDEPHHLVRDGHSAPGLEQALQEKEKASYKAMQFEAHQAIFNAF